MSRLYLAKDDYAFITEVSNLFIDKYMGDANDAQIKVYLYLIRMLGANYSVSISDITDKFNHTEKDVLKALAYWEKRGLLELDRDEDGSIIGIRITDLISAQRKASRKCTLKDEALSRIELSVGPSPKLPSLIREEIKEEPEEAVIVEEINPYEKPSYSVSDITNAKNDPSLSQLFNVVSVYMQRPLTPSELKSIMFYKDTLGMSDELIDYLVESSIEKKGKDIRFSYFDKVAVSWAEKGIKTVNDAKLNSARYDKKYYTIMNSLGKNESPNSKEVDYINRWINEYGFEQEMIIEACEITVMSTDRNRFSYCDSILQNWKSMNIHHVDEIPKKDVRPKKKSYTASSAPEDPTKNINYDKNRFNRFKQHDYDFDEIEKMLLSQ